MGQRQVKIVCCSQKTVDDLIDKGCVKNKTLILKPPKNVPTELIRHFIRGFFDGDGSLMKYQKSEKSISFGLSFTTTYDMAKWLQNTLIIGGIFPDKRRDLTWYYTVGGNQQTL